MAEIKVAYKSYIAREKCGCITAAIVDDPQIKNAVAKEIASWVRQGRAVERVDGLLVKEGFAICPKDSTQRYDFKVCKVCPDNQGK